MVLGGLADNRFIGHAGHHDVLDAEGRIDEWVAERLARHRNPSGPHIQRRSELWIQINERKTEDGGTVAVYSDITELKRREEELRASEERLQTIVDNSPAVIYLKNAERRYTLINHGFEEVYNAKSETLLGKTASKP